MSQRESDQPTGVQRGQPSQYQQSTAGGGQGAGVQQPAAGQSSRQSPGGGQGIGGRQQVSTGGQGTLRQREEVGGHGSGGDLRGQQFPTRTYLGEDARAAMIETLNWVLADATILHTHAKFAHWNVKGLEFVGLHELFDEIAEAFEEHTDLIGERITALGGQAMGTAGMAVANCSLPSMPTDAVTGPEYVEILAERLAIHDANLYESIQAAQDCGDDDTADLLNEVSREVSQYLWFLEAHLQTQPVGASGAAGRGAQQPRGTGQQPQAQGVGAGQGQTSGTPQQPGTGQSPPGGQGGGSI